jgi:hypothetical protein
MTTAQSTEAWQRGPVAGYEPMLMPVVHALLQVREDLGRLGARVAVEHVWARPGGAASIGFHVRHTGGALDRLFTYARGEMLSAEQRTALRGEEDPGAPAATVGELIDEVNRTIDAALAQLRNTSVSTLLDERRVGRAGLPSTVLGLLFHAAEHSTRHAGQAITTARILAGLEPPAA